MRDPKWIGVSPSNISWSDDSKTVYFNWNPDKNKADSLYAVTVGGTQTEKVNSTARRALVKLSTINKSRTLKVFEKYGDLFLTDLKTGITRQLTNTTDIEAFPSFSEDEQKVVFRKGNDLFSISINNGELIQLTSF